METHFRVRWFRPSGTQRLQKSQFFRAGEAPARENKKLKQKKRKNQNPNRNPAAAVAPAVAGDGSRRWETAATTAVVVASSWRRIRRPLPSPAEDAPPLHRICKAREGRGGRGRALSLSPDPGGGGVNMHRCNLEGGGWIGLPENSKTNRSGKILQARNLQV